MEGGQDGVWIAHVSVCMYPCEVGGGWEEGEEEEVEGRRRRGEEKRRMGGRMAGRQRRRTPFRKLGNIWISDKGFT